jgi:hypothetical protein
LSRHNGNWHVNTELPHRFPSREACEAFFVAYAKDVRYQPDAKFTHECEQSRK